MSTSLEISKCILVRGTVQGVGFRPFVYRLAVRHGLRGSVSNRSSDVKILVAGPVEAVDGFLQHLQTETPPMARIDSIDVSLAPPVDHPDFEIRTSAASRLDVQPVPPDTATCDECLRELFDVADRRYRYPFINCTNCGPRFTIVDAVPYDRERTTMHGFQMCTECQREYDDPLDRRFHAQPNGCQDCGPRVVLLDAAGGKLNHGDPITAAAALLSDGAIVAVKGIGGYHLAVDACNWHAVTRLRERKHREEKPLALMARDPATVRRICVLDEPELALLVSPRRPIVLLRRRDPSPVPTSVAHGHRFLGVMVPYSPLHHLLLADFQAVGREPLLVLTSGNKSEEPIAYYDEDALERLEKIADYFLIHDRPIRTRCDDSVTRSIHGQETLVRRARGYTPEPLAMPFEFPEPVLACGAHLKNSFCLGSGNHALVSHHVGDLDDYQVMCSYTEGIERFKSLFDIEPQVVAHDLHPDYLATRFAHDLEGVRRIGVQHHHAHVASVLAEHHLSGPIIGVGFDGTGFGLDGHIWGAEFLIADYADFHRAAHLEYLPLPGGDQAIRQPWRLAATYLDRIYGSHFLDLKLPLLHSLDRAKWPVIRQMIERNVNCPLASSMGRLFDAVAALTTGRQAVAYEGQAAIELEMLADPDIHEAYEFSMQHGEPRIVDPKPVVRAVVEDLQNGVPAAAVAARFHNSVVNMVVRMCKLLQAQYQLDQVALSGGVFQNKLLLVNCLERLSRAGFAVYTNNKVPANDGGISLGQAAVAAAKLYRERTGNPQL